MLKLDVRIIDIGIHTYFYREIMEYGVKKVKPVTKPYTDRVGHLYGMTMAVDQRQEYSNIDLAYKWVWFINIEHMSENP